MNRHAVLFANGKFPEHPGLGTLETPANDIVALEGTLKDKSRGFSIVEVVQDAASHEISKKIADAVKRAAKADALLLVYYSGHGVLDEELSLSLASFNTTPDDHTSCIRFRDLLKLIKKSARLRRVVILLDCCYSGAAGNSFELKSAVPFEQFVSSLDKESFADKTTEAIERAAAAEKMEFKSEEGGIYLMTATSPSEPALGQRGGLGLFTQHLVAGFKGLASPNQAPRPEGTVGVVTVNSLFGYVHRALQDQGSMQTPRLFAYGAKSSDMVITGIETLVGEHNPAGFRLWDDAPLLENLVPTYILDSEFRFVHWNAAFQAIVASPLKLRRGAHVQTFLEKLENWDSEVRPRSVKDFPPNVSDTTYPRVHSEHLKLRTPKSGYIDFIKVASRINGADGDWCVLLNISYAEKGEAIWILLAEVMTRDETWSRYAESYDLIIANFSQNQHLVDRVVDLVGEAERCLDMGAGTGSATMQLLKRKPERHVDAVDPNYQMLKRLYWKLEEAQELKDRVTIIHCDCLTATSVIADGTYDACVMLNVLFALDDPVECLRGIHRVLKDGGLLALSTSDTSTDIEALFKEIREVRGRDGTWDEVSQVHFTEALNRNREMVAIIRRYSEEAVIGFLEQAGFKVVEPIVRKQYVGCVFYLKAVKVTAAAKVG